MGKAVTFQIKNFFDTETCNVDEENAFVVAYIFNEIENIAEYNIGKSDHITIVRKQKEAFEYIEEAIRKGQEGGIIPVFAIYNAMFDLTPLLDYLCTNYEIKVSAKSSTSIYTMDLIDQDGDIILRFWDCSYLEPRGLSFMAEACGIEKLDGWDYSRLRTPETVLSQSEIEYAKRDVQIMPAYLKFLLDCNSFIKSSDFGTKVITKTSLVRLYGKREIGVLKNGKQTVYEMMISECEREAPKTYEEYAIRKASSRGGLTFTAANNASKVIESVVSLDVTSMHHAIINGRYVPCKFQEAKYPIMFNRQLFKIKNASVEEILARYHDPFDFYFNAKILFKNLRLKKNSLFDHEGIATLSIGKIYKKSIDSIYETEDKQCAAQAIRNEGFYDRTLNAMTMYGKLYEAEEAELFLNEIEFWIVSQVYDFDSAEIVFGEFSTKSTLPPDYMTLLSNTMFDRKQKTKAEIEEAKRNGEKEKAAELKRYYQEIVKAQFNAIYGSQVQDVNKPAYYLSLDGVAVDRETIKTKNSELNNQGAVNFIHGSRIVAGSRMHLIIGLMLLWKSFKNNIKIIGGDTDSIKFAAPEQISDEEIDNALEPLHKAIKAAIERVQYRIRRNFHEYSSDLEGIGEFVNETRGCRYINMLEHWNKCRIFCEANGHISITISGVSRPLNCYNIEDLANDMKMNGIAYEEIYNTVIGYGVTYYPSISYQLGSKRPKIGEMFNGCVCGKNIQESKTIALFGICKTIGDLTVNSNLHNIAYQQSIGNSINLDPVDIYQDDLYCYIEKAYTLKHKIAKRKL